MSQPLGRTLVPPRPNLGPEPWAAPRALDPLWLLMIIPLSAAVIGVCSWLFRRGFSRPGPEIANSGAPDTTPRGRLVALSISTKNALAVRFGATWRAKTTEELADEPILVELLGPEPLADLIKFLDRIDRLKFAPERSNHIRQPLENELADWGPRISALIARIESKNNGRHNRLAS